MMELKSASRLNEDQVILSVVLSFLPIVLVLITGLSLAVSFSTVEGAAKDTLIIWLSTTLSMSFVPMYILNRYQKTLWSEIGLFYRFTKLEWAALIVSALITVLLGATNQSETAILIIILQTLAVAINEEIWIRGILLTHLKKCHIHKVMIILITALIFGFATHMNEPFMDNLLWRFPGGLVLGYIALKTERLTLPIMLHYLNNLYGLTQ